MFEVVRVDHLILCLADTVELVDENHKNSSKFAMGQRFKGWVPFLGKPSFWRRMTEKMGPKKEGYSNFK